MVLKAIMTFLYSNWMRYLQAMEKYSVSGSTAPAEKERMEKNRGMIGKDIMPSYGKSSRKRLSVLRGLMSAGAEMKPVGTGRRSGV